MFCKENYKVIIIIGFLLNQSIVPKMFLINALLRLILIRTIKIDTYYVLFFMIGNNCSHKLRYEGYLELICRCLSDNMFTELSRMRTPYGEITCVYGKTHMTVA
jgi:hypothetical protein